MERKFTKTLLNWKENMDKPLMVVGTRQIGKTYLIDQFCQTNFPNYVYINLEKQKEIRNIFEETIDPEIIMKKISLYLNESYDFENTIFFFDECQVSEKFITSLKYFCEASIPYKIVCAGSLLGVKINRFSSSFPVGKVRIENMYPLDFEEFLKALNEDNLIIEMRRCYNEFKAMDNFLHEKALNLFRQYLCVGGMPEAVNNFIFNNDILKFDKNISKAIIEMYIADMNKYTIGYSESVKIEKVYKSITKQLAKENKKFQYSQVEKSANKRNYISAIEWLISSSMVYTCNLVEKTEIPLKAYADDNIFKLYLSDVGLLTSMSGILYGDLILDKSFMFKGAIVENYVAQTFKTNGIDLFYWNFGNNYEIDFLLYNQDGIIPIEVKASDNVKSKSLSVYMEKYKPKYGIRVSTKNFGFENNIKSIPLYALFLLK